MALTKFGNSPELSNNSTINSNFEKSITLKSLNHIRTLIDRAGVYSAGSYDIWGDAYIDSNGRNNSVTATTTCWFDTNKYQAISVDTDGTPQIIIEATSLTVGDFAINNCSATLITTGKWRLLCSAGTNAVKRAQLMKTLFYGTNGSDARIMTTYITGLTALKTNISRDVGKRAYYFNQLAVDSLGDIYGEAIVLTDQSATFSNQTGDPYKRIMTFAAPASVSAWSKLIQTYSFGYTEEFKIDGNTVNSQGMATGTSDELGTDTTADEDTSCATCNFQYNSNSQVSASEIDFYTTHSVPLMTLLTTTDFSNIIVHTIPTGTFSTTISSAIGVPMIADYEASIDIQYKFSNATDDSGWLSCGITPTVNSFVAFSRGEPTILTVKLIPKTSSPTQYYPSIKGFVVKAW